MVYSALVAGKDKCVGVGTAVDGVVALAGTEEVVSAVPRDDRRRAARLEYVGPGRSDIILADGVESVRIGLEVGRRL